LLERISAGGPGSRPAKMRSHETNVTHDTNSSQA